MKTWYISTNFIHCIFNWSVYPLFPVQKVVPRAELDLVKSYLSEPFLSESNHFCISSSLRLAFLSLTLDFSSLETSRGSLTPAGCPARRCVAAHAFARSPRTLPTMSASPRHSLPPAPQKSRGRRRVVAPSRTRPTHPHFGRAAADEASGSRQAAAAGGLDAAAHSATQSACRHCRVQTNTFTNTPPICTKTILSPCCNLIYTSVVQTLIYTSPWTQLADKMCQFQRSLEPHSINEGPTQRLQSPAQVSLCSCCCLQYPLRRFHKTRRRQLTRKCCVLATKGTC